MAYIDRDALIERLTRMWESRQLTNTKYKCFTEILTAEPTTDVVSKEQYDIWFEHANILAEELRKYQNADVVEWKDLDKITEAHEKIGYEKGYRDGYAQSIEDAI